MKNVITTYAVEAESFVPELAYDDAQRHLPKILAKHARGDEIDASLGYLTQLRDTVRAVHEEVYLNQKADALARIEQRDPDDWPILATAMVFECPIWTEDNDFFGTGVATSTIDRIELYPKLSD